MRIFDFFRRRKASQPDRVSFTDEAVTHVRSDGVEERIRWDELHEVSIVTTDHGPFLEDVFFLLIASDGKSGCVIPGFDNEKVGDAMASTLNAKFVCWKRPA